MLKFTKAALHKISDEISLFAHLSKVLLSVLSAVYLFVMCFIDIGKVIVNVLLLAVTLINLVSYLVGRGYSKRRGRNISAGINRAARVSKLLLNAVNLANVIYMIIAHAGSVEMITMVMTPILIIVWIAQLALELISAYVSSRFALFLDGVEMDFEPMLRAKEGINNAVHSFFGEDKEERVYVSGRNRAILEERAASDSVKSMEKKAAKREIRKKRLDYLLKKKWRKKDEKKDKEMSLK